MPSNEDKYAATKWGGDNEFDFTCPSGQVCRLRKTDPMTLISEGLLDKLDFLSGIVETELIPNGRKSAVQKAKEAKENVGKKKEEVAAAAQKKAYDSLLADPERMKNFIKTLDSVLVATVVKPEIHLPPDPAASERINGTVYADTVSFNDKMAIFNVSMKAVTDLEPFRAGADAAVGAVASSQHVSKPRK